MIFFDLKNINSKKHTSVNPNLLWEYDKDNIDYGKLRTVIIQRVIERGRFNDFYAIFNIYGLSTVIETVQELNYLNDKDMNFVSHIFEIPLEKLKCYRNKQLRPQLWNS